MKKIIIKIIEAYQIFLSPLLGRNCRFYPSCSSYAKRAVEKYGPVKGTAKGIFRIMRCGFWSKGGTDLP
jgi:hypothetical protein